MMCLKSGDGRYAVVAYCNHRHKGRIIGVNCFPTMAEAEARKTQLDLEKCGDDCWGNHPIIDQDRYSNFTSEGVVEYFDDEARQ